jgi:hypothetical protein
LEFWVSFGSGAQPAIFLDDISLIAAALPATVHLSVNATQTVRTVDARVMGINQVAWDGNVSTATSIGMMNDLGNPCLRWPGGSWGDSYHWTNEYRGWGSYSSDFIKLATNTHAQAFIIVNYGSSTAEEAAYGVRMFNTTNRCGFKYWEVGNECGGGWETDYNTNAPWQPHDPWTYAMRFTNYYVQMKAVDPTIKIGAVAENTEDGTANYTNHPVVNPRTGVTHNGWTPVMLTYMRSNNVIPDFLIHHKYAPNIGDQGDLLWSKTWASDAASLRQMLTDYLGSAGSNVTLECTENGCGGDRQRVSLVGGLFYADTVGQVMQTEFNSRIWWDTRNGQGGVVNSDPTLYGWRTGWFTNATILTNSLQYYYDEGICYGGGYVTNRYPAFYTGKLLARFAAGGDQVVKAATDYPLLTPYAVVRTNGTLSLLVINKSSSATLSAGLALTNFLPLSNATVYSYGILQDEAARTNGPILAQDLATNTISLASSAFSYSFPPYSATVLNLSPWLPPVIAAHPTNRSVALASNTTFNASAGGTAPLAYQWRFYGTNLPGATNLSYTVTNAQPANEGDYCVVVTNLAGMAVSSNAMLLVLQPPVINTQPQSRAAVPGGSATFSIVASGRLPLAYQWLTNGTAIAGQTNSSLNLTSLQSPAFADYTVLVTNTDGSILSDVVHLTLALSPTINGLGIGDNGFSLAFPTELGPGYIVEYKDDLGAGDWLVLTNCPGSGQRVVASDPNITNTARFYRLRLQ